MDFQEIPFESVADELAGAVITGIDEIDGGIVIHTLEGATVKVEVGYMRSLVTEPLKYSKGVPA